MVALARALYKKPKLLLLDEPTAALDRDAEQFVLGLLEHLKSELAIILLTHRIGVARRSDRIYVLKNGVIEMQGDHYDLINSDNLYSRSWQDLVADSVNGVVD